CSGDLGPCSSSSLGLSKDCKAEEEHSGWCFERRKTTFSINGQEPKNGWDANTHNKDQLVLEIWVHVPLPHLGCPRTAKQRKSILAGALKEEKQHLA
ncbi:MAG: hypothetical protein ACRDDA_04075, partial [Aeromonas sp.]